MPFARLSSFRCPDSIGLRPVQPVKGAARGPVFATDPAVVAEAVEQIEKIRKVHFTDVRLVALGNAGDLYVPDVREIRTDVGRQIAVHDLAVIEIHLQPGIRRAHGLDQRHGLALSVQKIARNVPAVDRLDQDGRAVRREDVRPDAKVAGVDLAANPWVGAVRRYARHHVDTSALQRRDIGQRRLQRLAELVLPARHGGQAALAALPVPGRQVEQSHLEAVAHEQRGQIVRRIIIRKQKLHGPEARLGGAPLYRGDFLSGFADCGDAFEDWLLAERRRLAEVARDVMQRLLDHYVATGAIERGIFVALRLLQLDPLDEASHRSLIRLYLYQDRVGAALRQYELCREELNKHLGVAPSADTETLRDELLQLLPKGEAGAVEPVTRETDDLPEKSRIVTLAADRRARTKR